MKKKLLFLYLICIFVSYSTAESGYKNIPWFSTLNECKEKIVLEDSSDEYSEWLRNNPDNSLLLYTNNTVILGKKNRVSYEFVLVKDTGAQYLIGISYIIDTAQLPNLLKKLPEPSVKSLCSWDFECLSNDLARDANCILSTEEGINECYKMLFITIASEVERNGTNSLEIYNVDFDSDLYNEMLKRMPTLKLLKDKGTISIYEYNNDTRMYIFDKIISDKAIIVYVRHEQDY